MIFCFLLLNDFYLLVLFNFTESLTLTLSDLGLRCLDPSDSDLLLSFPPPSSLTSSLPVSIFVYLKSSYVLNSERERAAAQSMQCNGRPTHNFCFKESTHDMIRPKIAMSTLQYTVSICLFCTLQITITNVLF